jgi:hypothetical protein
LVFAALPAPAAELHIRLYDLARTPAAPLERSKLVAQRVLAKAGIHVSWTEGGREDPQAYEVRYDGSAKCSPTVEFSELRIRLVAKAPPGSLDNVLGTALPCSNIGVQVTIYMDRANAFAWDSGTLANVLGHAMTHEIGHVLLRSAAHSRAGIMKMRWSDSDWQAALCGDLTFDPEQAAGMLRALSNPRSIVYPHDSNPR